MKHDPHFERLMTLVLGAFSPPPGIVRIILALILGITVHTLFTAAVIAMMVAMYFGMSRSLGAVPWPYAGAANFALIVQFPLMHSLLLTQRGGRVLAKLAPGGHGATLSTTTYAIIASLQLLLLFACWTPSGIVWWRAEGTMLTLCLTAYAFAWLLLIKATYDAGMDVQSGALGWLSLLQKIKPRYPDMPHTGLFRVIRQPIYVAFALTLWTVPIWTPDQLALAIMLTAYCLIAPILKERRLQQRYGARFLKYKDSVPYAIPALTKDRSDGKHQAQ
ncbi:MAG: isoprenylcysteine carboxylmethyltransferase family protein [Pseudomonadota bacterium]